MNKWQAKLSKEVQATLAEWVAQEVARILREREKAKDEQLMAFLAKHK